MDGHLIQGAIAVGIPVPATPTDVRSHVVIPCRDLPENKVPLAISARHSKVLIVAGIAFRQFLALFIFPLDRFRRVGIHGKENHSRIRARLGLVIVECNESLAADR